MNMPHFWKNRSFASFALLPFSFIYSVLYILKRSFTVQIKLPIPVVCIGNVTAGGSGKTPVALHIGKMLKQKNINAFYVSRGYGGTITAPTMVNPAKHRSYEVGDEPLLLAEVLPTVVGKDKIAAARFAIAQGAQLLIFDDGFQNKKFFKDFSILVIDGSFMFGNNLLLPAGPLREYPVMAFARAHSIIVINRHDILPPFPENKAVLFARSRVVGLAEKLNKQKIVAFCGIALPEKFRATLVTIGARIIEFVAFPDHANYRHNSLLPLAEIASKEQAFMVTTRKDYVRLPRGFKDKVVVVDIDLEFETPEILAAHVDYIAKLAEENIRQEKPSGAS